MTTFWPNDLNVKDTSSPLDILNSAQDEWREQSGGLLDLVIQETKSEGGHDMLIVHARHALSNRTVTLFSVVHRAGAPYPATIQPREEELPNFLKKSYYPRGHPGFAPVGSSGLGRQIVNEWVCDTPAEFRSKLSEAFNLGIIKHELMSLVAGGNPPKTVADESQRNDEVSDENASDDESAGSLS